MFHPTFPLVEVTSFGKDQAPNTLTPGIFHHPWHRTTKKLISSSLCMRCFWMCVLDPAYRPSARKLRSQSEASHSATNGPPMGHQWPAFPANFGRQDGETQLRASEPPSAWLMLPLLEHRGLPGSTMPRETAPSTGPDNPFRMLENVICLKG